MGIGLTQSDLREQQRLSLILSTKAEVPYQTWLNKKEHFMTSEGIID